MGEKIIILDVIVMGTLYLHGFATAVKYAAEIGENWTALNLPTLGIMAVGGGIWFFHKEKNQMAVTLMSWNVCFHHNSNL